MEINVQADPQRLGYRLSGSVDTVEIDATRGAIMRRVVDLVAEKLAEQFLHDHGPEILARLDPQAIANLAIADSGRAVREALEKQVPREVQHHYHDATPQVYKVGVFGGVKRIR